LSKSPSATPDSCRFPRGFIAKKPFAHKGDLCYYEADYWLSGVRRHALPGILLKFSQTL
jgi:hypothetical protein